MKGGFLKKIKKTPKQTQNAQTSLFKKPSEMY